MTRYIPDDIKAKVWRRDGGRCVVCGSNQDIEYDHIIPFSKGGSNTLENVQILCKKHNRQKRDFIDAGFILSKSTKELNNKYIFRDGYIVEKTNPKIYLLKSNEEIKESTYMQCFMCGRWFHRNKHNWIGTKCSEECYWDLVLSHFRMYNFDALESFERVLNKMKENNISYDLSESLKIIFEKLKEKGLIK